MQASPPDFVSQNVVLDPEGVEPMMLAKYGGRVSLALCLMSQVLFAATTPSD